MKRLFPILLLLFVAATPASRRHAVLTGRTSAAGGGGGGCDTLNDSSAKAYWRMEEAEGANREDTKGANDLDDQNNNTPAATGLIGDCANFDAADKTLIITDNADVSLPNGEFGIDGYVNFTRSSAVIGVVSKGGGAEFAIYRAANDKFQCFVFDSVSGFSFIESTAAASDGVWYYFCLYYDTGDDKPHLFLVGGTYGSGTTYDGDSALANGPKDAGADFRVGTDGANGFLYGAKVDELLFTHRKPTSGEMTGRANYSGGVVNGCRPSGL